MAAERSLALVLHAHLPWVKGEPAAEPWFFEAVADCYLPLLELFENLERDGLRAPVALSLSPTLLALFDDDGLRAGAGDFLRHRINALRAVHEPELAAAADWFAGRGEALAARWEDWSEDLAGAFAAHARRGTVELFTCGLTHGFLPLLGAVPQAARAQVLLGAEHFHRRFGVRAKGFWLPECGYTPGAEHWVAEAGARWFVLDEPSFLTASPPPLSGARSHVFLENGVAAFARDVAACERVWNAKTGFPGHADYLDFHHRPLGPRLHRVTGQVPLLPWNPERAFARARADAATFVSGLLEGRAGLSVCAFDAELFGHWWAEGPVFLHEVLRQVAQSEAVRAVTPSQWLAEEQTAEFAALATGSWGRGGHSGPWLSEANRWLWPYLTRAAERMVALADAPGSEAQASLLGRLAAELLLAQASDWPFLLDAQASTALAARRVETHLARFLEVSEAALNGDWNPAATLAATHNPLGQVDFRVYRSARG